MRTTTQSISRLGLMDSGLDPGQIAFDRRPKAPFWQQRAVFAGLTALFIGLMALFIGLRAFFAELMALFAELTALFARLTALCLGALVLVVAPAAAQEVEADVEVRVDDLQSLEVSVQRINDFVFKIEGEGALFLINTSDGSVLVDTGTPYAQNEEQRKAILEHATGPIKKIIVTHFHGDHSGGLPKWKDAIDAGQIEFIAHHRYGYMARIQDELTPFFLRRYYPLYPTRVSLDPNRPPQVNWQMRPTRPVFPGADYAFELGGVEFVVIAPENGGEGEDGVLVWLPESKILFTGDLFGPLYPMFPNLYTVRGEKYRDPLDYIDALDVVLELEPKVIAHSHFRVIEGEEYIQASVRTMRDAVQYMWNETVAGMNAGKTVWELMRDIKLPERLQVSQGHGKVSWSVRATYDLVTGWYYYDTIANLYHVPPTAINHDLVELVGGADVIAERARGYLAKRQPLEAIRLLDIAAGHETKAVLMARIEAVEQLLADARAGLGNYSEIGLLEADLRASRKILEDLGERNGKKQASFGSPTGSSAQKTQRSYDPRGNDPRDHSHRTAAISYEP